MKVDRVIKELFRDVGEMPEVNDAGDYEVKVIYWNRDGMFATTIFYISAAQFRADQESELKEQWMEFYEDHCYTVDGILEMYFKNAA